MIHGSLDEDPQKGRLQPAGFPSPAADFAEAGISLDKTLIDHRSATFFFRAAGHELVDIGIFDGDLLVVDRSVAPAPGHTVVAVSDGEFVVRPFEHLKSLSCGDLDIWGVVRWAIHRL